MIAIDVHLCADFDNEVRDTATDFPSDTVYCIRANKTSESILYAK